MPHMKIVVFGANGGSGKQVVERALAAGHEVTAAVRRPAAYEARAGVRVVQGDVLDPASVAAAIAGADAVISTFGPANNKQPGTLMSEGVKNIVAACEAAGVKRLVFESGLMTSDGRGLSFVSRLGLRMVGAMYAKMRDDKRVAEATIRASSLDYVIVRPPVLFDGPPRRTYVHGVDHRINPAKKLAHADVAELLVQAAHDARLTRTTQDVGES